MDDDRAWERPLLVDLLPAPPAELAVDPGARMVAVSTPRGVEPYVWHPGIILAWARIPGGGVACLMVWQGVRKQLEGRPRVGARWSWCHFDGATIRPIPFADPANPWGLGWHGWHDKEGAIERALAEAAGTLPAGMRAAAVRPADVATVPILLQ
jgi:hypothetical protein